MKNSMNFKKKAHLQNNAVLSLIEISLNFFMNDHSKQKWLILFCKQKKQTERTIAEALFPCYILNKRGVF